MAEPTDVPTRPEGEEAASLDALTVPEGFYGRDWVGSDCWVDRDGAIYAGDGPFAQRAQVLQLRRPGGDQ